ncbi:alpha/beta hydrolase family protein [Undibacterium sp. TJN19]|uniref:alpha/beta hydrolase family protein n=1 Tax=Undibacterium sp. TJN19 TaxID=3413055 RepID=UPI003BF2FEDF
MFSHFSRLVITLVLPFLTAVLNPATQAAENPARPYPVGLKMMQYEDSTRLDWTGSKPRPLATAVWYPADAGVEEKNWDVSIFKAGRNAMGAPMLKTPEKLPLILVSHGTGGSAASMAWLAESLAANGYIVAAVNHHGNTGYEGTPRLEGFVVWWDRPKDLSVLIDKLIADPVLGKRIDTSRIAVAGFSIGGYTALASVGGKISYAQWEEFCSKFASNANCKLPPEARFSNEELHAMLKDNQRIKNAVAVSGASYRDDRIKAAYAIAPVMGRVITKSSMADIKVPVRIVVGADDDQAIPEFNAQVYAASIPGASLQILPAVTHYTFLAECTMMGKVVARQFCVDPDGLDRQATHQQVAGDALKFFRQTLH